MRRDVRTLAATAPRFPGPDAGISFSGVGDIQAPVFDGRPMNIGLSYFYNVEHPDGGAGQQLRLFVSRLYPEHRGGSK